MRTMKAFCLTLTLGLTICVPLVHAQQPPNLIFLMADDLGFGDVGFNGNGDIQTPHLDQMAREGIRFTRFYTVGPVCSPTRACVQTGRHCMRFGMINVNVGKLPEGEINLAKICKANGYTTGHFGKWHLGTMTRDASKAGPRGGRTAEGYGPPWERGYDVTFTSSSAPIMVRRGPARPPPRTIRMAGHITAARASFAGANVTSTTVGSVCRPWRSGQARSPRDER